VLTAPTNSQLRRHRTCKGLSEVAGKTRVARNILTVGDIKVRKLATAWKSATGPTGNFWSD